MSTALIPAGGYAAKALDVGEQMLAASSSLQYAAAAQPAILPIAAWLLVGSIQVTENAGLDPLGGMTLTMLNKPAPGGDAAIAELVILPAGATTLVFSQRSGDSGSIANSQYLYLKFAGYQMLIGSFGPGKVIALGAAPTAATCVPDANGDYLVTVTVTLAQAISTTLELHPAQNTTTAGLDPAAYGMLYVGRLRIAIGSVDPGIQPLVMPAAADLIIETLGGLSAGAGKYKAISGTVVTAGTYGVFALVAQRGSRTPEMDSLGVWKHAGQIAIDVYLQLVAGADDDSETRRLRNLCGAIIADLEAMRGGPIPGGTQNALHHFTAEEESLLVNDETGALAAWGEATILLSWQSP